ncbi:MAG: hypothetical protein JHC87_04915 [Thermoleophilaceae bacterium]|nr:hypothetical protein [Thermoleophilaceae bacterium]
MDQRPKTLRVVIAAVFLVALNACLATAAFAAPFGVSISSPAAFSTQADSKFTVAFAVNGGPDNDPPTGAIFCHADSQPAVPCDPSTGFTQSELSNGTHQLSITAYDTADLANSATASVVVKVNDATPPTVNITAPGADEEVTDTPVAEFLTSGASSVQCRLDGHAYENCDFWNPADESSPGNYVPKTISNGAHSITVRASDPAGNVMTDVVAFTTADTDAPVPTISEPADGDTVTESPVSFAVSVDGTYSKLECKVDATDPAEVFGSYAPCYNGDHLAPSFALANATGYTITARATDAAGNEGTSAVSFDVDDTSNPEITVSQPLEDQEFSGVFSAQFNVDQNAKVECNISGAAWTPCDDPTAEPGFSPAGDHVYAPRIVGSGSRVLHVRAKDATDTVVATADVPFNMTDTTEPGGAILWPTAGAEVTSPFAAIVSDPVGQYGRCSYKIDSVLGYYQPCSTGLPELRSLSAALGSQTLRVRFIDQAGNITLLATTFNVVTTPAWAVEPVPPAPTPPVIPPPPPPKPDPSLTIEKLKPKLQGKVYSLAINGELRLGTTLATAKACVGSPELRLAVGKRIVAKGKAKFEFVRGQCFAKGTLKVKRAKVRGKKATLSVAYAGSVSANARTTRATVKFK